MKPFLLHLLPEDTKVVLVALAFALTFGLIWWFNLTLDRLKLLVPLVVLFSPGLILVGLAQDQLTIDASKQPSPPARGRGPFPSSTSPGHSTHLPIRLELRIPSGPLQPDGTTPVDFVIINMGNDIISLPSSIKESDGPSAYLLTLVLTAMGLGDCGFDFETESAGVFGSLGTALVSIGFGYRF